MSADARQSKPTCKVCGTADVADLFWDGALYCNSCLQRKFPRDVVEWHRRHAKLEESRQEYGSLFGILFTSIVFAAGAMIGGLITAITSSGSNFLIPAGCFVTAIATFVLRERLIKSLVATKRQGYECQLNVLSYLGMICLSGMLGAIIGGMGIQASLVFAAFVGAFTVLYLGIMLMAARLDRMVPRICVFNGRVDADIAGLHVVHRLEECTWYYGTVFDDWTGIFSRGTSTIVIRVPYVAWTGWTIGLGIAVGSSDELYSIWEGFLCAVSDEHQNLSREV